MSLLTLLITVWLASSSDVNVKENIQPDPNRAVDVEANRVCTNILNQLTLASSEDKTDARPLLSSEPRPAKRRRVVSDPQTYCVDRYSTLSKLPDRRSAPIIPSAKEKLIVLDLDETVLFQRNVKLFPDPYESQNILLDHQQTSKRFNDNFGLVFLHLVLEKPIRASYWTVYRQNVMELIADHIETSDFAINSLAMGPVVVQHALMLELYYNYVHAKGSAVQLQFKCAIPRVKQMGAKKSIPMMATLVDLSMYKQVIVVDDALADQTDIERVWDLTVPKTLSVNELQVIGIVVPMFSPSTIESPTMVRPDQLLEMRAIDKELIRINEFIKDLANPKKSEYDGWCRVRHNDNARIYEISTGLECSETL